jgi:hypothetical protein
MRNQLESALCDSNLDITLKIGSHRRDTDTLKGGQRLRMGMTVGVSFADADQRGLQPQRDHLIGHNAVRTPVVAHLEHVRTQIGPCLEDLVQHISFSITCEKHVARRGLRKDHDTAGVLVLCRVVRGRPEHHQLPLSASHDIASSHNIDWNIPANEGRESRLVRGDS